MKPLCQRVGWRSRGAKMVETHPSSGTAETSVPFALPLAGTNKRSKAVNLSLNRPAVRQAPNEFT